MARSIGGELHEGGTESRRRDIRHPLHHGAADAGRAGIAAHPHRLDLEARGTTPRHTGDARELEGTDEPAGSVGRHEHVVARIPDDVFERLEVDKPVFGCRDIASGGTDRVIRE